MEDIRSMHALTLERNSAHDTLVEGLVSFPRVWLWVYLGGLIISCIVCFLCRPTSRSSTLSRRDSAGRAAAGAMRAAVFHAVFLGGCIFSTVLDVSVILKHHRLSVSSMCVDFPIGCTPRSEAS